MDDGTYKPSRVSVSILYLYIFLYFLNKNFLNLNLNLKQNIKFYNLPYLAGLAKHLCLKDPH